MKLKLFAIGLAATLAAGPVLAKDWSTVRIAVDVPYEPFEFKLPDGTLTGFEVDLGNAVCAEIKAKCEWVVQGWDGIIPGLISRKYDAIMSSMNITAERREKVLFSEPYYSTPSAWFGKKDVLGLDVTSKDALKGKVVGVQRGTIQDTYVTDNFGSAVDVKRYATADELVLDLTGGRLDLVFLDYPVGEQTIITNADYSQVGTMVKMDDGVAVAFRKKDEDLAQMFNAALKKLKEDGTYDTIMKKYFKYDIKI